MKIHARTGYHISSDKVPLEPIIAENDHTTNIKEYNHAVLTRCDPPAARERISLVSSLAPAHSIVHDHSALGTEPAGTRARVTALLVDTGQVAGTLTMD